MSNPDIEEIQRLLCEKYGLTFSPCAPDAKLGLADHTLGQIPIHGLRHPPTGDTSGWYIWAGEYSREKDFFHPLHTSHMVERLPQVVKFLGLPPGSRFLLAPDRVDVWFDEALLDV